MDIKVYEPNDTVCMRIKTKGDRNFKFYGPCYFILKSE